MGISGNGPQSLPEIFDNILFNLSSYSKKQVKAENF